MDLDQFVSVGKVTKAHGIKGEIKVFAYSEVPEDFQQYRVLTLVPERSESTAYKREFSGRGSMVEYSVVRCRTKGKAAILILDGVGSRDEAEALCGSEIWVEKNTLQPLESDEYYWHDMLGLRVVSDDGMELGTVQNLFATGAHDVLVVKGRGREYLIPAKKEFVVSVDRGTQTLVVCPPPGLLEIND